MAGGADHKGLASPFDHDAVPRGLGWSGSCKVGELADVMNDHLAGLLAELAPAPQEPGDQLGARVGDPFREAVVDDRRLLPLSGIPPNRATSGFLCAPRPTLTSKHLRSPYGVSTLALCLAAIFDTVERCLLANVFSIEVSMTQRSRCSVRTFPASR